LKRAFMAGYPSCKFSLRGQDYEYNFQTMLQKNAGTGKMRNIRPPFKWKAPKKPIVPPGETMVVTVPADQIGKIMEVPHPNDKDKTISVLVPKGAKAGQTMLVPVPPLSKESCKDKVQKNMAEAVGDAGKKKSGGKKVAVAGAVLGGACIVAAAGAGGVLVAEHGIDGAVDVVSAAADDVGAWAAGAAGDVADAAPGIAEDVADWGEDLGADAVDFAVDVADDVADFVMDLF